MSVLIHHGIQGQRWGVRRFQNADGSFTEAGKKRYQISDGDSRRTMQKKLNRLDNYVTKAISREYDYREKSKQYRSLAKQTKSKDERISLEDQARESERYAKKNYRSVKQGQQYIKNNVSKTMNSGYKLVVSETLKDPNRVDRFLLGQYDKPFSVGYKYSVKKKKSSDYPLQAQAGPDWVDKYL